MMEAWVVVMLVMRYIGVHTKGVVFCTLYLRSRWRSFQPSTLIVQYSNKHVLQVLAVSASALSTPLTL
jgi:hypothetical protein